MANHETEHCAICLSPLDSEHVTALNGCGHAFHSKCIVTALQHNSSCPLCRYRPTNEDDDTSDEPNDAEDDRSRPPSREQHSRRSRAIRSILMRVYHRSASRQARQNAMKYRSISASIAATRQGMRSLVREVERSRRFYTTNVNNLVREHNRQTQPLRRQWTRLHSSLRRLEDEHTALGDSLAADAGFTEG